MFAFCRRFPIRCCGDRAGMRRKSDERRFIAVALADQLSEIELSA